MPVQPIRNSKGDIVIKGAVVGFELWDAEVAVLLMLKLEQFESCVPVIGQAPAHWEPTMPAAEDDPARKFAGSDPQRADPASNPQTSTPTVHMLQVAIPVRYAQELGWALQETAKQIQRPESESRPV